MLLYFVFRALFSTLNLTVLSYLYCVLIYILNCSLWDELRWMDGWTNGWKTIEERGRREEGKEGTEGKKIGREEGRKGKGGFTMSYGFVPALR